MRMMDLLAAVNIVDPESPGDSAGAEVDAPCQLSFPSEYPAGEPQLETNTFPEFDQYKMPRQAEAGQTLTDLTTEKETGKLNQGLTQHGLWNESYHNENQFEDTDKMGDADKLTEAVYPPYTQGGGSESRYDDVDKSKYNIVVGASREPWVCVDLDNTILSKPERYQDGEGNQLFGEPLPGAREALQEMVDAGMRVSIYTARQYFEDDEVAFCGQVEAILDKYDIPFSDVYWGRKPPSDAFIDDRNIVFDGDWSNICFQVYDKLDKQAEDDEVKDTKDYHGISIDVEWPKGSIRSYDGDDTYATHMKCDYGYAQGVDGADGDSLDIYLGDVDSDQVFIINQVRDDGSFDEQKLMLGFNSEDEAVDMYLQHMPAFMFGSVQTVPFDIFVNALYGKPEDRRDDAYLIPSEEKSATNLFKPKINRKPKSDYVGPQSAQSGGIGGPVGSSDIESTKVWPGDDIFENEFTDGLETRENLDIPRPPNKEKLVYRNASPDVETKVISPESLPTGPNYFDKGKLEAKQLTDQYYELVSYFVNNFNKLEPEALQQLDDQIEELRYKLYETSPKWRGASRLAQRQIKIVDRQVVEQSQICPYCDEEIREKSLYWDRPVDRWYHRSCMGGPITFPPSDQSIVDWLSQR